MKFHPTDNPIRKGDRVPWHLGLVRVLAIAEGYAMVRYYRAGPFIVTLKELYAFQVKAR